MEPKKRLERFFGVDVTGWPGDFSYTAESKAMSVKGRQSLVSVVLYCNFRSLAFFGFIGLLNKAAKK